MRVTKIHYELTVDDFKAMIRAYLKLPAESKIEVRIDGADFTTTFEEITVVIEDKK